MTKKIRKAPPGSKPARMSEVFRHQNALQDASLYMDLLAKQNAALLTGLVRSTETMREVCRYLKQWNPEDMRITSLEMQIGWNETALAKARGEDA